MVIGSFDPAKWKRMKDEWVNPKKRDTSELGAIFKALEINPNRVLQGDGRLKEGDKELMTSADAFIQHQDDRREALRRSLNGEFNDDAHLSVWDQEMTGAVYTLESDEVFRNLARPFHEIARFHVGDVKGLRDKHIDKYSFHRADRFIPAEDVDESTKVEETSTASVETSSNEEEDTETPF
jgi:hypothetical protein